jgi:hypothetical protein
MDPGPVATTRAVSCPYLRAACSIGGAPLAKSSGLITGWTRTVAPDPRKRSSAMAGIRDASSMFTTMYPPLAPLTAAAYLSWKVSGA